MNAKRETGASTAAMRTMSRLLVITFIVSVISSCSTQSARASGQPTKQEAEAAISTSIACIKSAIVELDDRISSAETVGRSAVLSCSAQVDEANRIYLRANFPEQADDPDMLEKMKSSTTNIATSLVLKNRAQSR